MASDLYDDDEEVARGIPDFGRDFFLGGAMRGRGDEGREDAINVLAQQPHDLRGKQALAGLPVSGVLLERIGTIDDAMSHREFLEIIAAVREELGRLPTAILRQLVEERVEETERPPMQFSGDTGPVELWRECPTWNGPPGDRPKQFDEALFQRAAEAAHKNGQLSACDAACAKTMESRPFDIGLVARVKQAMGRLPAAARQSLANGATASRAAVAQFSAADDTPPRAPTGEAARAMAMAQLRRAGRDPVPATETSAAKDLAARQIANSAHIARRKG